MRSVKLYGRVPLERIRTLALDEGSRTSAALARILLKERFGLEPELRAAADRRRVVETDAADAVLLIGDRGDAPHRGTVRVRLGPGRGVVRWTGLPFVFAMWMARPGVELRRDRPGVLAAARDEGLATIGPEIARRGAPAWASPRRSACRTCATT